MHNTDLAEATPADQPTEIEDEYTLALEADVEDDTLLEQPGDIKFTITSYGADYTVDTLIRRLKSEAFYVPQFQRRFVWSQRHASRFGAVAMCVGICLARSPIG
jgi:hypothetical protein